MGDRMVLESFKHLQTVNFDITEVLTHCQNWKDRQGFSCIETPRPDYGLYFLKSGKAVYRLGDGTSFSITAGEIMLLPQDAQYKVVCYEKDGQAPSALLINFKLRDIRLPQTPTRIAKDDGVVGRRFAEIHALYQRSAFLPMKAKLYELMELLLSDPKDECCLSYIGNHLGKLHTVASLAKRASMCESAYRKHFKALTGQSPAKYINALKIERACRMLQSPEIGIEEICDTLGFFDPSHFYKVFKAVTGKTPGEYKRERD